MGRFPGLSLLLAALLALAACGPGVTATPTPVIPPTSSDAGDTTLQPLPSTPAVPPTTAPVASTAIPIPSTATPASPTATPVPPTPTPPPPTPTPAGAATWLDNTTIVGFYGRAFGVAPVLGRLGEYQSIDEMAKAITGYLTDIQAVNGGKKIVPEIHLIYALAVPCEGQSDCLLYEESVDPNLVDDYIKPAQQRGWLVVLDTQLGRSDPVTQIQRMIDKGYLNYDNVEVALDPEYHVAPGHLTPGVPVGQIDASQVNAAQKRLDDYVQKEHLPHRKILVVHQFGDKAVNDSVPWMITNKTDVTLYANVDLVIDADKLGDPATKVTEYNEITDNTAYPFIHYRGMKVFPKGANAQSGNYDNPLLTWRQVFGLDPTSAGAQIQHAPDLVIIN